MEDCSPDAAETVRATAPEIPPILADIVRPLTHCPRCTYDLTGLPAEHRCPECGFQYNDQVLEVVAERPRKRWQVILSASLTLLYGAWLGSGIPWRGGSTIGYIAVVAMVAMAWWLLWARRRHRFYAFTPVGLIANKDPGEHELVPWSQVKSIRHDPGGPARTVYFFRPGFWDGPLTWHVDAPPAKIAALVDLLRDCKDFASRQDAIQAMAEAEGENPA